MRFIILFSLLLSLTIFADEFSIIAEQENVLDPTRTTPPLEVALSGYIKAEAILDSRQNLTERSGHYLYFPLNERLDVLGRDINSRGTYDEYAIQSRLRFEVFGPLIFCMDSRAYIEGDFFGQTDETVGAYRMRHAYLALESENMTFIAGQTWHPISIPVESPDTISFNSGSPINPYSRNPQFRFEFHTDPVDFIVTAIGWIHDRPFGPLGPDSRYFRNSMMPDFNAQVVLKMDNDNYVGVGFDIMRIVPRLETNTGFKEVNPFSSFAADAYARLSYQDLILYTKFAYAQNASIWNQIGGYGVHSVEPITDLRTYAALRTISYWAELIFSGWVEPALFIGFAKNLGASKTIIQAIGDERTVYGIGTDVNTVFRASPRVRFYIKSFVVGAEIEYTRATFGIPDQFNAIINTHPVSNTRFLFATYYIF